MDSIWTDELVQLLTTRFNAGLSYSAIASELGVTRSTISGKIARLQLPPREQSRLTEAQHQQRKLERNQRHTELQRQRRANRSHVSLPPLERPVIMPFMGSLEIPFCDLDDFKTTAPNQCRYIAGEPAAPDYLACGNPTADGASYCTHHTGIVFNRPIVISDDERARRAAQATRNWNAAVVKAQNGPGPMEATA
jgi:GcrA cell cycle regulator